MIPITTLPPAAVELAAAAAANEVLCALAPGRKAEFGGLLAKQQALSIPDSNRRDALRVGKENAAAVLALRADDGSATTVHYVSKSGPGQWRRTGPAYRPPEAPHWRAVRPFSLFSPDQFRAPVVPSPESPEFSILLDEVRDLGGKQSVRRTEEQTSIANFWSDFSYTSTPPGHWNEILRDLSGREGLDLHDSARAFYLLNLAMADAGIAVWDSKYFYNTWRPVTAIQASGIADWQPLFVTPPHPDYLSGHSGFSGAAATILSAVFPDRPAGWSFTVRSDTLKEATRTFSSFTECANEISLSRVYGGIHFRHACEEGLKQGERVAGQVLAKQGGKLPQR